MSRFALAPHGAVPLCAPEITEPSSHGTSETVSQVHMPSSKFFSPRGRELCNPNAGVHRGFRGSRGWGLAFGEQNLLKVWLGLPGCWHSPEPHPPIYIFELESQLSQAGLKPAHPPLSPLPSKCGSWSGARLCHLPGILRHDQQVPNKLVCI